MSREQDRAGQILAANGIQPEQAPEAGPAGLPGAAAAMRPACPVAELAGPLGEFVRWGIRDGLHPECTLAAGLAALATLTGPARLRVTAAVTVRAILWVALIGVASAGKSPAFRHAFALIREAYGRHRAEYQDRLASWREQAEAEGKKAAGPEPGRPEPLELDDATVEAVVRWLEQRGDDTSGAVIDDELAAFLEGLNQYKGGQGSDLSKWLKMWTGAPVSIMRVGKGGGRNEISLYVPEPVVSLAGPLVPDNLHLLGKPGSGFRPRWLPFYAPAEKPRWGNAGDYPAAWRTAIGELIENRQPRDWTLSAGARREWERAARRWHAQESDPEPDDVIEALRKADQQCLRIALVIAESISPAAGGEIPAEAMTSAISIIDYVIGVWRVLPGNSTMTTSRYEDVMDRAYRRFLAWLENRPKGNEGLRDGAAARPRATRRELQQWLHEKPAKIDALIREHNERWGTSGVVLVKNERDGQGHGGHTTVYLYAPPTSSSGADVHIREPAVAATAGSAGPDTGITPGQEPEPAVADRSATAGATAGATADPTDSGRPSVMPTPLVMSGHPATRPARAAAR